MSPIFCEFVDARSLMGKRSVMIDNSVLTVCMACSKRGKPYVPASQKRKTASTRFFLGASLREFRLTDDTVLDPEYAKLIREARTKIGFIS